MGSKWVLVLFMFVSLEGCLSQISGCWDEERVALLQLKHFFNDTNNPDWLVEGEKHKSDWPVEGERNSDCCQWKRVECNNSTGRVISLYLQEARGYGLRDGYLNASLFSAFEQLEELDLWGNSIAGFVDNGGLDKLSRLRNLESLDLGNNMFNNDIFLSLNALPSLTSLYLRGNRLNETVDLQGLYSSKNLTELDLSFNQIEKVVFPKGLDKLSRLRNLEYLHLERNMFNNDILSSLNALPSLKSLYLWGNSLNETVDLQGLYSSKNLTQLDLSNNEIEKVVFPKGLDSCKNLKDLDLRYNQIEKVVFPKGLDSCKNLKFLRLGRNQIEKVVFPKGSDKLLRLSNLENLDLSYNRFNNNIFSSLGALSSLKYLYLNDNGLKGVVNVSGLDSLYNLEFLNMSNNEIGKLIFPKGLRGLKYLYLENVNIHDGSSLLLSLVSFPSLKSLDLSYNNFSEMTTTQEYLHNFTNLEELWLDGSSLHISLLQFIGAFTSLNTLSMPGCQLNGILHFQGSDWLSRMSNLKYLDLEKNMFNNSILSLGALSSLKKLRLNDNRLRGIVGVPGLKKLETLYLRNVSIDDGISSLLHSLASLPSLRILDLRFNNFSESTTTQDGSSHHVSLPHGIAAFTNLEELYLQNCQIYGTSSFQDLPNFKNLKYLSMDYTSLDLGFLQRIGLMTSLEALSLVNCGLQGTLLLEDGGVIPKFLYHQQHLEFLDLSNNNLTGGFPNWLLENNTELQHLFLANNLLGGYLSIHSHMNLTTLDISSNSFQGHIPKEVGEYLPSLETLNLSRNHFDGSIPSSIGDMTSLQSLDLSYNNLFGEIPEHLAEGCTSLSVLVLSNNKLGGKIFSAKFNLTNLMTLQLNGNSFTGSIPDSLSKAFHLVGLYLGDNKLSGRIPSWLGNMSRLEYIIMPSNHFEGPIPLEFCQFQSLEVLNLAKNNLSGSLPSCSSPLLITHVHLSRNKLQGQLKDAFFNSSSLVTLDLGYNRFDGSIPTWIDSLSELTYLILSNNNLEGEVPTQLCKLNQLRLVDLSHNNLSGYIPPCLNFTALRSSDHEVTSPFGSRILGHCSSAFNPLLLRNRGCETEKDRIKESVEFTTKTNRYSYQGKVLTYMSGVDLSCNKLTGPIPPQVGNLTGIHTLNLSHNNLNGPIPLTFSKLKQIESLDLSYNNLNGKIPPQLVELYFLSSFSVAHNNLSGKTPERVAQFITFDENSYEGNPLLCGPPLHKSCVTTRQPSPMPGASTDKEEDNDLIDMNIFYMSFTGSYIIVLLGIAVVLYINPYWRRAWFYLAETWMTSCYYFIVDNLPHRFRH